MSNATSPDGEEKPKTASEEQQNKLKDIKEAYRRKLIEIKTEMEAQYDKAVMTLSGGAFGVSVLITREVINDAKDDVGANAFLVTAWFYWALSLSAALFSFYWSAETMDKMRRDLDSGKPITDPSGGWQNKVTKSLNFASGFSFLLGLLCFIWFVANQLTI